MEINETDHDVNKFIIAYWLYKSNVNTNKSLNKPINSEDRTTSIDECLNYLDMSTLGKQENNNISDNKLFCNKYTEAKSEIALFFLKITLNILNQKKKKTIYLMNI